MKTVPAQKKSVTNTRPSVEFIKGDSFTVLDKLFYRGVKADLVLGSPPYPFKGERYLATLGDTRRNGGKMTPEVWIEWMLPIIQASLNVAHVCAFVVNDSYRNGAFHPAVDGLNWRAYSFWICSRTPAYLAQERPSQS